MGNKDKDGKAGSVALFNTDISRSDAENIQCWCRLVRAAAAEKFSMLLVSVLFTENIDVSDGFFWGLTDNSAFNLWYENSVELYKPVDAPKVPKRKSGEAKDDWKQRMTMYNAKLTNWSTKIDEAKQRYRQIIC